MPHVLPSILRTLAHCALAGAALAASGCATTTGSSAPGETSAAPIAPARFEYSEMVMGVEARITLYAPDEEAGRSAARAAFDRLIALDKVMSDYDEKSELSRLNARAGEGPVEVSDDLYRILSRSRELAEATGGAFDPTVGPIVMLWRNARKVGTKPHDAAIASAIERTGWRLMSLDSAAHTVSLARRDMRLDLGAIGKGFGAQEAGAVLAANGISSWLVAVAGDIVAGEAPPDAPDWRVVVDSVSSPNDPVRLGLRRYAVTTSGDTEQYVEVDGVRYSHIVDPRTGLGVRGRSRVTVIARDGATADALASAISVLGADAGFDILERFPDAEAIVEEVTSAGLRRRVSINEARGLSEAP